MTEPAPPSDCPSRCMSLGSVCATSTPNRWARSAILFVASTPSTSRNTHSASPSRSNRRANVPALSSRVACRLHQRAESAHTRPATGPPLAALYPYDTAVELGVYACTKARNARLYILREPFGRADQMRQATLSEPLPVLIDQIPIADQTPVQSAMSCANAPLERLGCIWK